MEKYYIIPTDIAKPKASRNKRPAVKPPAVRRKLVAVGDGFSGKRTLLR
jgi:hypothetical protein